MSATSGRVAAVAALQGEHEPFVALEQGGKVRYLELTPGLYKGVAPCTSL